MGVEVKPTPSFRASSDSPPKSRMFGSRKGRHDLEANKASESLAGLPVQPVFKPVRVFFVKDSRPLPVPQPVRG